MSDLPANVVRLLGQQQGWITAEPQGAAYAVRIYWRPDLYDLARDFDTGGAALTYTLLTAEKHGLAAVLTFRPSEEPG
ncbi:hypothetical protein [Altericroceibacterium xinjiangense]|uniref:hypothetical protein n=1 Tax=Altericroceibacterium xinjiangense TaxID=762261 RepID=UPI000F7E0945|nr:hypothetical protein [Altericroceibacterium xinjiangense]